MNANTLSLPAGPELPDRWRAQASAQLAPGETLLGWMEVDLNTQLRFTAGVILLTDRRLLSQPAEQAAWHSWPLPRCNCITTTMPGWAAWSCRTASSSWRCGATP